MNTRIQDNVSHSGLKAFQDSRVDLHLDEQLCNQNLAHNKVGQNRQKRDVVFFQLKFIGQIGKILELKATP